jgi:hypothetical protein
MLLRCCRMAGWPPSWSGVDDVKAEFSKDIEHTYKAILNLHPESGSFNPPMKQSVKGWASLHDVQIVQDEASSTHQGSWR